jgi:hypothetical protein
VAPATNGAPHHPENLEDDANDNQKHADDPENSELVHEESDDQEEYA